MENPYLLHLLEKSNMKKIVFILLFTLVLLIFPKVRGIGSTVLQTTDFANIDLSE